MFHLRQVLVRSSAFCQTLALHADEREDVCPGLWARMYADSRARGPDGAPVLGKGKQIALDIARGLAYLHSQHVVHLDLKSPNGEPIS